MTPPARHDQRTIPPWAWPLALSGLAIVITAAAAALFLRDIYTLLILAGLPLLGIGSYFLGNRMWVPTVPAILFGGFLFLFAVLSGASGLARNLWGTTAVCQVEQVQKEVAYSTENEGSRTRVEVRTYYAHETACADGTYRINADSPYSIGARVEVLYDPRTHDDPVFVRNGDRHQDVTMSAIMLAVSGPVLLLLPFVARGLGRRRRAWSRPSPSYGTGQFSPGPAPFNPAAPQGQWGPQPGAPDMPALDSPEWDGAFRRSVPYKSMRPEQHMLAPFIVRLVRRRMGIPQPPPPNPLADPRQPLPSDRPSDQTP
jgi:hypothetical protein